MIINPTHNYDESRPTLNLNYSSRTIDVQLDLSSFAELF